MMKITLNGGKMEDDAEEKKDGEYEEYELCSACETLAKAEEIKSDAKLMAALKPMLEKKAKSYKSLASLRAKGEAMAAAERKPAQ